MAFAAHCGVSIDTDGLCYDPLINDVDGNEKRPDLLGGRSFEMLMRALFNEELGAVVQIRRAERSQVMASCAPPDSAPAAVHRRAQPLGPDPHHPQRQGGAQRSTRRSAARLVGDQFPHAATARPPGMRAAGVRPDPRYH
jgi:hypothetical protein